MPGRIKNMIDTVIEKRSAGNPGHAANTRVKMIMKGIYPDKYTATSQDDLVIIEKLLTLAKELNIEI